MKYPYAPTMQHTLVLNFQNIQRVVTVNARSMCLEMDAEIYVRAPKRVEHSDSKMQMVRKEFLGLEKGECGRLVGVFENLYGRFVMVERHDGRVVDALASDLETIDEKAYKYQNALMSGKFYYETTDPRIPEFIYDREIDQNDLLTIRLTEDESISVTVKCVQHVMGMLNGEIKPLFIRLILES